MKEKTDTGEEDMGNDKTGKEDAMEYCELCGAKLPIDELNDNGCGLVCDDCQ